MPQSRAVSIIVPAYNVEPYIEEALRSVQAQTFDDFECVIVDDGSEDRTAALVEPFLADSRFRLIRLERRGGVSAARNAALRASSGDFVAFLDPDDVWLPGILSAQLVLFKRDPRANLVFTNFAWMRNGVPGTPKYHLFRRPCKGDPIKALCSNMPFWMCTLMLRRRVLESIDGFDETFPCAVDYNMVMRAAQQVGLFVRGDMRILAYRRSRPGSLTRDREKLFEMNLRVLNEAIARENSPELRSILNAHSRKLIRNHTFERLTAGAYELLPHDRRAAAAKLMEAWQVKPRRLRHVVWALRLMVPGSIAGPRFPVWLRDKLGA